MGVVVEKTPNGAFALVIVMGTLPVLVIWNALVAEVPTGTSPKSRVRGICRCAAPETAVAVTCTVTDPRSLVTTSVSVTGLVDVGLNVMDTATDARGWMVCPTDGTVAGSARSCALAGSVTPVILATVVPVLTMLTVCRLIVFVGTSVNCTVGGVA